MFQNITKEEVQDFEKQVSSPLNLSKLKQLEKMKLKAHIVSILIILASVLAGTILSIKYSSIIIVGFLPILIATLIIYPKLICLANRSLNDFIKQLSNGKLTYKEYKVFKTAISIAKDFGHHE